MSARPGRADFAGAAVAIGFAVVGAYAVIASLEMTMLGAIFPRTMGGVLIALSLAQAALALTGRGGGASEEGGDTSGEGLGRRLGLIAVMVAWALLFPVVGFVVTSTAASVALLFIAEHERPTAAGHILRIATVVAMVGAFYWLMISVLHIPMPRGLLF